MNYISPLNLNEKIIESSSIYLSKLLKNDINYIKNITLKKETCYNFFSPDYFRFLKLSINGLFTLCYTDYGHLTLSSLNLNNIYPYYYYYSTQDEIDYYTNYQSSNNNDSTLNTSTNNSTNTSTNDNDDNNNNLLTTITTDFLSNTIHDIQFHPNFQYDNTTNNNTTNTNNNELIVISQRDKPVQLYNIKEKKIISNYIGKNHLDELDILYSLCFNTYGNLLYVGSKKKIYTFDLETCQTSSIYEIFTSKSKNKNNDYYGQHGIISTISYNNDGSNLIASGSYNGSIGIYQENQKNCYLLLKNLSGNGISHIKWSSCGNYIWYTSRQNNFITCYDIRMTNTMIGSCYRNGKTNQKLTFDIDPWSSTIATGSCDMKLLFYNMNNFQLLKVYDTLEHKEINIENYLNSISMNDSSLKFSNGSLVDNYDSSSSSGSSSADLAVSYQSSSNTTNSTCESISTTSSYYADATSGSSYGILNNVIFHPFSSTLLTSCGQRIFPDEYDSSDDEEIKEEIYPLNHKRFRIDDDENNEENVKEIEELKEEKEKINEDKRKRKKKEKKNNNNESYLSLWYLNRNPQLYPTEYISETKIETEENNNEENTT